MRFVILPLISLVSSSLALPSNHVARDVTVIERSLKNVALALTRLSTSIRSIDVRMSNVEVSRRWPEVERDCHMVSDMLLRDAREIRRAPSVSLLEAAGLIAPINNLETESQKVIDDWIAIKPAISIWDRQTIQKILKDHEAAASEYADAILSRQTALASPAGRYFGSRIKSIIEKGISAYKY